MKKNFLLLGILMMILFSMGVLANVCSSTNTLIHMEVNKLEFGGKEYGIYISDINAQEVRLVVGGESTRTKLKISESYKLADGKILTVTDILYQDYAGGTKSVKFCIDGNAGKKAKPHTISPTTMKVDLSNYPSIFMKNKVLNAYFVIGLGTSTTTDTLLIADIWLNLEKEGYSYVQGESSKVDTEINDPLNTNLILIGKASDNKITSSFMKSISGSLNKGEGMLKLFENKGYVQLLVTGYSEEDVKKAAKVLENYKQHNLKGKEIIITGTLNNPIVKVSTTPLKTVKTIEGIVDDKSKEKIKTTPQTQLKEEITCTGCKSNGNCLPYGTKLIKDGKAVYCNIDKSFKEQEKLGVSCQNNYECLSNQCSDGKCISLQKELKETKGLLEKILRWIKSIFS